MKSIKSGTLLEEPSVNEANFPPTLDRVRDRYRLVVLEYSKGFDTRKAVNSVTQYLKSCDKAEVDEFLDKSKKAVEVFANLFSGADKKSNEKDH